MNQIHQSIPIKLAKQAQRGFSLFELLISTTVIAIISSLAIPSLAAIKNNTDIKITQQALLQDLRLLRAAAINQGLPAYLCALTTEGDCTRQPIWNTGWMGYVDINKNGHFEPSDIIINTYIPADNLASNIILRARWKQVKISAMGTIVTSGHFKVCDASNPTKQHMKVIRMNNSGRMTLESDYQICE